MTFDDIIHYLDNLLLIPHWKDRDMALNGLQVSRHGTTVRRVAFAVDACQLAFERAVSAEADLLIVHHGLFWGVPLTLTGAHYQRIKFMIEKNLALYAVHLPLDAHPDVGNNIGMGRALGLENLEPFGRYRGVKIGFKGNFSSPRTLDAICETLFHGRENTLQVLPFGKKEIKTVGLVSGGASRELSDAIEEKLDLFITGDADHTVYHQALEAGMNVIFGGHYATETWGIRLLAQKMKSELDVLTVFLDLPTGL